MKVTKISEEKKQIRLKYKAKRNKLTEEKRQAASEKIATSIIGLDVVQKAENVFLYASCKTEVFTRALAERLISMGKQVAFPKVNGSDLTFYPVETYEELRPGYQGIYEPDIVDRNGEPRKELIPQESDVVVIPGLVFNQNGERIGYGGGFYDRYFTRMKREQGRRPVRIGICYHAQLCSGRLPMEEQDCRMDYVVTEKYVYQPAGSAEASALAKAQIWGNFGEILGRVLGGFIKG